MLTRALALFLISAVAAAEPLTARRYRVALPDGGTEELAVNYLPDGGMLAVVDVELATLVSREGKRYDVAGGVWLDDAFSLGYARELADKRARVEHLEQNAGRMELRVAVGLVLAGAAAAVVLQRWGPDVLRLVLPPSPGPSPQARR